MSSADDAPVQTSDLGFICFGFQVEACGYVICQPLLSRSFAPQLMLSGLDTS